MKKISALAQSMGTLVLAIGISSHAFANTGGGATIHNAATLSYSGGSTVAAVDVAVQTVAAQPTATVTTANQTVTAYSTVPYVIKVTSNSNGTDVLHLALSSTDANTAGSPGLSFLLNGSAVTSVTLAASVTSKPSGAGLVYIPAGSEGGFQINHTISIAGNLYTVTAVTVGTIATTSGGVTTPETASSLTLTPVGGAPAITAGSVAAGVQIGEQVTLTEQVVASAPSSAGVTATHTVAFTGTSTATDLSGATVTYNSATNSTNTVTTVVLATTSLNKYVRNVSRAAGNAAATGAVSCGTSNTYYSSGVVVKPTDKLEYCLVASNASGQPTLTGAKIADPLPPYTSYVLNSTLMNGAAVADVAGASPLVQASGMDVKSPGAASIGQILSGEAATVIFQVNVQ